MTNSIGQKQSPILGIAILAMGLPTIFFFEKGVFDEYDYWTGTVSLVIFALAEVSFLLGSSEWIRLERNYGWCRYEGSKILPPNNKYITPLFIGIIFLTSLFKPLNGEFTDWSSAFSSLLKETDGLGLTIV